MTPMTHKRVCLPPEPESVIQTASPAAAGLRAAGALTDGAPTLVRHFSHIRMPSATVSPQSVALARGLEVVTNASWRVVRILPYPFVRHVC